MTIIAVDDERDSLDLISDLIYEKDPDSEILEFEDPLKALALAREQTVDVAFISIMMQELDGLELGRYLKELNPSVNLIFLSEEEDDALQENKRDTGASCEQQRCSDDKWRTHRIHVGRRRRPREEAVIPQQPAPGPAEHIYQAETGWDHPLGGPD